MLAFADSVTFAVVLLVTLLYVVAGTVTYEPFLLVIDICKIPELSCIYLIDTGLLFVLH